MYDSFFGRTETPESKMVDNKRNWSAKVERNWNCRCTGKAASEAVTRCAACIADLRSTDIRDSMVLDGSPLPQRHFDKCNLVTCPAVLSPHSSPIPNRIRPITSSSPFPYGKERQLLSASVDSGGDKSSTGPSAPSTPILPRLPVSPLALKRLRAEGTVSRPLSVSSIASSTSSSSGSSCSHRLGVPHKSSAYLASIESLDDTSETERRKSGTGRGERFKCNDSQGSADSGVHSACSTTQGRPKYYDHHLSYMDRVVMEIIETEGIYVRDLQDIKEGYLRVWQSDPEFPLSEQLGDVFGNIEDIHRFNSKFLRELKQCDLDPVKVARCFVSNNDGFSVYTEYCTNYPRTVSMLTELMRQEAAVRLFRDRQTALQHTLPLGSYLLKPVQRILKYHLLLQNIVKQSSKDVSGYSDIEGALTAMTGIAQHINDMKRRHEHAVRVQEIQSLLYGWEGEDLTTYGELCAEGTFRMSGAKALRHIFLFDKMLLIAKKKEEGVLSYKAHINCANLMLIESVPGEPLCFHVIPFDNPRLQYTLQARNYEQKREWTQQLKRVILENYNAVIPSHARQLVMELGQQKADDDGLTDRTLPKRHHSAPEYLERRKQDRRKSDVGFRQRLRRTRKSDAGSTSESQQKPISSSPVKLEEASECERLLPSESSTRSESPPSVSEDQRSCTSTSQSDDRFSKSSATPRKVSIDLNNAEEVQSIEQIVGQLLMQNREFERLLKRQKHLRSRHGECMETRSETTDEEDDGIYETLLQVKLVLEGDCENDSDYVTLCPGELDKSLFRKQRSLREGSKRCIPPLRRVGSCRSPESLPLKLLESTSSVDKANIPTLPSVWLRQQGEHLATPSKKAGSLPRSFQINLEGDTVEDAFKEARNSAERPFTIASDQPPSTMIYEDMDRYNRNFPFNGETTEDESLTEATSTPAISLDRIDLHPDYRIYRSGLSQNAWKNVLTTVSNKLSVLKGDFIPKTAPDEGKVIQWERKASRLLNDLARHCNKTLRNHIKGGKSTMDVSQVSQPPSKSPSLPVFMQGSSSLGARIANFDTKTKNVRPSRKAAALLGIQPDSLISLTESLSSFSELDRTPDSEETVTFKEDSAITPDNASFSESDGSLDSFYERSFEAMDDEELLNDNAVHSDQEELFTEDTPKSMDPPENLDCPPPLPLSPSPGVLSQGNEVSLIVHGVEEDVFKRSKSIRERQRELEQWRLRKEEEGDTSSQHSTASTVIEVSTSESSRPKGWVRHVVGKLQGSALKTDSNNTMIKT